MPIVDVMNVRLVSVAPEDSVSEAIARMVAENVGSVAVCDGSRLAGILTERDILRLAAEAAPMGEIRVDEVMTTNVVTVSADADILAAARLMGERRVRHLPVVEGDNLLGLVGIRDVLGALTERLWETHDEEAHETVRGLLSRRS